jgi:hypothetical protein
MPVNGERTMVHDPHNTSSIPAGTPVVALNGEVLGTVREVYPHYILIDQPDEHLDLDLPVHAVESLTGGKLHITLNREALTRVDHEETVHREMVDRETPE